MYVRWVRTYPQQVGWYKVRGVADRVDEHIVIQMDCNRLEKLAGSILLTFSKGKWEILLLERNYSRHQIRLGQTSWLSQLLSDSENQGKCLEKGRLSLDETDWARDYLVKLHIDKTMGPGGSAEWTGRYRILEYPDLEKTNRITEIQLVALHSKQHTMCLRALSKCFIKFGRPAAATMSLRSLFQHRDTISRMLIVFGRSWPSGEMPKDWKKVNVTPAFKNRQKESTEG